MKDCAKMLNKFWTKKSYYSMKLNENNIIELKYKVINFDDNQRLVKKSKRKQILRLKSETNDNPIVEETNELSTALSGTVISTNLNLYLIDIQLLTNPLKFNAEFDDN